MGVRVGINGFGRIGRLAFRAAMNNESVEVVGINDLTDARTMAYLLKHDSVHGTLEADIAFTEDAILVNGKSVRLTAIKDPSELGWDDLDVDIVMECTGIYRDRAGASKHIEAGAKKVIISAPAKDPDVTLVLGVNTFQYDPKEHHIISNASCTTNCIAPVAKVLMENFGILRGLMTTVHAYTGDQRLLDFPHKDLRRARAAALSMIPTSTGAAKAVGLVLPELQGKLNGLSIRVPTPNVSIVDLVVNIEKSGVNAGDVNGVLKSAAEGYLKGILGFCEEPLVSVDYNGSVLSSIVDAGSTSVIDNMVKVLSWYDNESGYSNRMVDLAAYIAEQAL
ncbi:MAG: type I glyceraldehyde-3-phosphate dehydrogenase [Desulfobacterales bacterium C00003106]|nr:type I glyceraldehyde-3-phosphate dehydrogenase [Deltaproteobacteria bacterium]OEU56692.1 MAG: type I glyceraldehyde-3-phosphate dehydrogenase [Desulfobacterales bacterium C00003106]OEU60597.1 MAG: type I glyceraldehyde-3-phosphate dehydrogenase [Desulfobacterales bacterium C00003104]